MKTKKKRILLLSIICALVISVGIGVVLLTDVLNSENITLDDEVDEKESSATNIILKNANVSILGDSISTYEGISNNGALNSTISINAVYYPTRHAADDQFAASETYWSRIIAKYDMNLLVNNSASGSLVVEDVDDTRPSGIKRCTELHDNRGENAGTEPDIIAVYMGTNDLNKGKPLAELNDDIYAAVMKEDGTYITPTTFTEGYIIMLDKITKRYSNADVFCFTLLPSDRTVYALLNQFNDQIRTIAAHYGLTVVDIAEDSGITRANRAKYMRGSHPGAEGMGLIADVFDEALIAKYGDSKTAK